MIQMKDDEASSPKSFACFFQPLRTRQELKREAEFEVSGMNDD